MIRTELDGGVLIATIDRPERRNALDPTALDALCSVLDDADARDEVQSLVITGVGRSFCVGGDISSGANAFAQQTPSDPRTPAKRDHGGLLSLRLFASLKPVVAAVNGDAVGLGSSMLLPMDARLAVPDARFGFPFTRRGIVPESASSWFLPRRVGITRALDWTLSGRIFPAAEAAEGGLLDRIIAPDRLLPEAIAVARSLGGEASGPAVAATRRLLWTGLTLDHPMAAHRAESAAIRHLGSAADAREGVTAFLEKRPARFTASTRETVEPLLDWWPEPPYDHPHGAADRSGLSPHRQESAGYGHF